MVDVTCFTDSKPMPSPFSKSHGSLQGFLLIASPQLQDSNFVRSVVLMVQHDGKGAFGLVLNKLTGITVGEAWEQVSDQPCDRTEPLHAGGPCAGPIMVIHRRPDAAQIEVCPSVYFSAADDTDEWMDSESGPLKFFVGYAGWGPGQLERELREGSWLVKAAKPEQVFAEDSDLWQMVMRDLLGSMIPGGFDGTIIPPDPTLN